VFAPRSWNQRYCRQSPCLGELHRWQATKRQRRRRQQAEPRQQHAQAERQRRRRQREAQATAVGVAPPGPPPGEPEAPPAAAAGAWSRSEEIPHDFCDRPGCYAPLGGVRRGPSQYCAGDCRQAERRVQDRERKFKARRKKAGPCAAQERKPAASAGTPRTISVGEWRRYHAAADRSAARVRTSSTPADAALSSRDRTELPGLSEEVLIHDSQTAPGSRPRAPPSG
jgi:hypothetical protein